MRKKIVLVFYSIVLLLPSVLAFLPLDVAQASPDQTTNSPSAFEDPGDDWAYETWAYSSDNQRSYGPFDQSDIVYSGYGFRDSIPENYISIDQVVVKCEGYVSYPTNELWFKVSVDGGVSWLNSHNFGLTTSETMKEVDITGDTSWTRDKLNDGSFEVWIQHFSEAMGCFPDKTYLITWNETIWEPYNLTDPEYKMPSKLMPWILKDIAKAEVGDLILVWNRWDGIHLSRIDMVKKHFGTWEIYDIWSGTTVIDYKTTIGKDESYEWKKHTRVTGDHPATVLRDHKWITIPSEKVRTTDYLRHLWHEESTSKEEVVPLKDHSLIIDSINKITVEKIEGYVYDVITTNKDNSIFLGSISESEMIALKELRDRYGVNLEACFDPPPRAGKWSAYVDWLPVEVEYTAEEEEEELWDCSYIGTNCTLAGTPTELSADFSDLKASKDLDKYLFSWNNSGIIENSTWLDTWDGNWTRVTRTLNATIGLPIAFRFFVNDSLGVEYPSSICFFVTEVPSRFNWFPVVLILAVVLFLAIVFALTKT